VGVESEGKGVIEEEAPVSNTIGRLEPEFESESGAMAAVVL